VFLIPDYSGESVHLVKEAIEKVNRKNRDVVVASVHWGGNWGWDPERGQRDFAHRLIDHAGVHVVHGHSSHHVKGIEVYKGKLILYGCGDLVNDYEGIDTHHGQEAEYRGEVGALYFADIDVNTGELKALEIVPTRIRHLSAHVAGRADASWLAKTLTVLGLDFQTKVEKTPGNALSLVWSDTAGLYDSMDLLP
jgi:poly-gamma-glutamate synthesis protein (capsule biosynthesis protein)